MMQSGGPYLTYANRVPGHHLNQVEFRNSFDTWGVILAPDARPSTLVIGRESREFGRACWPFMAVHEAIHSVGTPFFDADDYRFLLFNILEDWRINTCARARYPDLESSFLQMRRVIFNRWESRPIVLKSPVSQILQHLCYLNHVAQKLPTAPVNTSYVRQVLSLRETFGCPENWPVVDDTPDRETCNHERGERLLRLLEEHRTPPQIAPVEIRQLLLRCGYDLGRCRTIELPGD